MRLVAAESIPTERLDLVPLRADHADEMAVVLGDPDLHEFVGGQPLPPADLRARYERWVVGSADPAQIWLNWVIRLRETAELVGTVQATVDRTDAGSSAELAWIVGTPWQGRGFASEAAAGLAGWLRAHGCDRLVAHVSPTHYSSERVARSIGLAPTDRVVDGETEWVGVQL